nr:MAG TPA: hypothetical protein [Caudoviricetes sp.]
MIHSQKLLLSFYIIHLGDLSLSFSLIHSFFMLLSRLFDSVTLNDTICVFAPLTKIII